MTIDDVKEKLNQEKIFASRFPARIIFTERLDDYCELVNHLKGICHITINVADFCRAPDTVPQFNRISDKLKDCADKFVLLLSVGEYLRLCIKKELDAERCQFQSFWEKQQPKDSKTRVIIPMFSCREIFDRIIGAVDERQQDHIWKIDSARSDKSYVISVYSPKFKEAIKPDANNLSAWFREWENILQRKAKCSIVTLQCGNVETTYGKVNINLIDSPFRYLMNFLTDGDKLVEGCLRDDFWSRVVNYVSKFSAKVSFAKIVLDALNVNNFDFVSVVARWKMLDDFQKNLVWLWYRVYPAGNYFSYACRKAATASDIPNRISKEILLIANRNDAWINERVSAMKALHFTSYDDAYFALIDNLSLAETKLKLLTYQTHEEKTYAVKVISSLLRGGAEQNAIAEMIRDSYPALAAYMTENSGCDEIVDAYMTWYRKNKIINRYCGNCPVTVTFEKFDSRYKLIHKFADKDCFSFWIDGFGVEYLPLFLFELKTKGIIPDSINIALALLPTDTKYNHQWTERDLKLDKLDTLSHKGTPDDKSYYSCIVHQLDFFAEVTKKVEELLEKNNCVVITGDHGSSRMAALAFHEINVVSITPPQKSTVHNFGRFCKLDDTSADIIALPETVKINSTIGNETFLVMNTYRHFSMSGNAAGGNTDENDVVGEIHGGNTPEERLVPVIVIKRNQPLPKIICTPQSKYVRKKNGRVETVLSFNRVVSSLEVFFDGKKANCAANSDGSWRVILDGVIGDDIVLSVVADGRLTDNISLKVKKQGIMINDDPFGGMGL